MELLARKWSQYKLNPNTKEPRQWYSASTEMLEEMLMMRFAGLPMNVVVTAHIDKDKDELHGEIVRNPAAPGRLRSRLGAAFAEQYHVFVRRDERGNPVYAMQTQNDGSFYAQSQINAPNPCWPSYEGMWQGKEKRKPVHLLAYGELGSGKSTMLATFPKPMLVFMWDPYGKDEPYLRTGEAGELVDTLEGVKMRVVVG